MNDFGPTAVSKLEFPIAGVPILTSVSRKYKKNVLKRSLLVFPDKFCSAGDLHKCRDNKATGEDNWSK